MEKYFCISLINIHSQIQKFQAAWLVINNITCIPLALWFKTAFLGSEEFGKRNLLALLRNKWALMYSANLVESLLVNGVKKNQNVSGTDCSFWKFWFSLTHSHRAYKRSSKLWRMTLLSMRFECKMCVLKEKTSWVRWDIIQGFQVKKKDLQKVIGPNIESWTLLKSCTTLVISSKLPFCYCFSKQLSI